MLKFLVIGQDPADIAVGQPATGKMAAEATGGLRDIGDKTFSEEIEKPFARRVCFWT